MQEELGGLVPTPAWKKSHQSQPWYTGDTIITGIGQGSLLTTPLQLASATATLATRGKQYTPMLVMRQTAPGKQDILTPPTLNSTLHLDDPTAWKTVIDAMQKVITAPEGTAFAFGRHPPYTVAAKTGTAQIYGKQRNETSVNLNIPKKLRNNHLFISFAPVDHPKIALAIVVEHSGSCDLIARKLTDFYLNETSTAG